MEVLISNCPTFNSCTNVDHAPYIFYISEPIDIYFIKLIVLIGIIILAYVNYNVIFSPRVVCELGTQANNISGKTFLIS